MAAPARRILRQGLLAPSIYAARLLFGLLPWAQAQRVGRGLGRLAARVARRDTRRALEHLAVAFPELDSGQREERVRASYRHLGMAAAELLHLWARPPQEALQHVHIEGFDHVTKLRSEGRAVLILTGHCGNWELISCANESHGLQLAAMARDLEDAKIQRIAHSLREHFGSETVARGSRSAGRQLLRILRGGGALALLIDQDIETESVFVPFFGRLANTPTAAADIALRLGAGVVPTFSERLEDGSHRVTFHPPLDLPNNAQRATALMTASIEAQIRRRPDQWVWFHRRWRRRPASEEAEAGELGAAR
ncbi:MAG: lysophospholipid acyltransferase family protein [Acidobacteriota bacterium]